MTVGAAGDGRRRARRAARAHALVATALLAGVGRGAPPRGRRRDRAGRRATGGMWLNTINSQYFLALAAVVVLLEPADVGRARWWAYAAIVVVAGLSGPVTWRSSRRCSR